MPGMMQALPAAVQRHSKWLFRLMAPPSAPRAYLQAQDFLEDEMSAQVGGAAGMWWCLLGLCAIGV